MYHYETCGLPYVYLRNGYELVKTPYGEGVTIHDLEGLHRAIGRAIVESPIALVGCEFRYLRQELELSQARLGSLLGRDEQTVARWEKSKGKRVDPAADRLLRLMYRETISGGKKFKPVIEMLQKLDATPPQAKKRVALERNTSWHATSVAAA